MPNRLARETSPYLQQHADNPVDWYPWGPEALERARAEDKPILLSIGYSACHWCHVMAHESFEDPEVARVMNEHFVNVKVDREERPDIDQIYQGAHQMLAQRSGGWPLTMFLAPDQVPFFGGTYFPKESRYNLPGFVQLMERVMLAWREKRAEIAAQNEHVREALAAASDQGDAPAGRAAFSTATIDAGIAALAGRFDRVHGGFGQAPKFPHPSDLALCMRAHARLHGASANAAPPADGPLHIALHTLEHMAAGGIYDHVGGGFCRYAVDRQWMIPHFEKMLYDNGPLLGLYVDAFRVTRRPLFARVVDETAAWVVREMQSPEGGYYSSLDADSEGEEGRFYRWTREELAATLKKPELAIVDQYYGTGRPPNFEEHYWHLHVAQPLADAAKRALMTPQAAAMHLEAARARLYSAREARVRPGRDEKILTGWNALMIAGMARAARVFDRDDWLASARGAAGFIRGTLWRDGRLLATYKDGRAHLNAYLDDYAYLLDALVELMQAGFRAADCAWAQAIAEAMLAHFEDDASGGFFFTSHDHERLIQRTKQGYDNAMPAGNAVAAFALQRLGHLVGEPRYLAAAERAIGAFHASMVAQPAPYATMLAALEEALDPPSIVVLRGEGAALGEWASSLHADFRPQTIVVAIPGDLVGTEALPPALAKPRPATGVNAYICRGVSCSAPIDSLDKARTALSGGPLD